jgi:uncharacterized coiled-coil protein SlyX
MTASQKLTDMIDDLVASKTFSLDALEVVKKLKDRAADLEHTLTMRDGTVKDLNEFKTTAQRTIREQQEVIKGIEDREKACADREAKLHVVEMERAVAQARAKAFEESMKIVFAPNMVRNSVQSFGGISRANGVYENTNDNRNHTVVDGYSRPGEPDASGSTGVTPSSHL